MEMDRGVQPLPVQKKKPLVAEFNMNLPSLESKLKDHFRTRHRNFLTPQLIAR